MKRGLTGRILLPNLAIVIGSLALLAMAVLLIVRLYLVQETESELMKVRATATTLIEAGLMDAANDTLAPEQAARITRQTSLLFGVKVLVLGADFRYPEVTDDRPLPESAIAMVKTDRRVYQIKADGAEFAATAIPYNVAGTDWNMLIFISMEPVNSIMSRLALVMLLALAGSALIASLASAWVAKRIAGPLRRLSRWAHAIGGRRITPFNGRSGTQEIDLLADSLNGMAARLEEYDASQKTFLQNASHELRTPLMSIQGYAEGIKHGVFTDTGYAAGIIIDESLRLSALVDDLLYLSRVETADSSYAFTTLPIGEVLGQCVEKLEGAAIKESKALVLAGVADAMVYADGEKLMRAVMNLSGNCLRYARSTVEISSAVSKSRAIITVRDDGPGFAAEDLPRLFERFYKGRQGKSGLGLSIAKAIVEKHSGRISAANDEGGGALFQIDLPLCDAKAKDKV